ncbi:hypothetical protein [Chamaesiphon minutus]|uniref:hypothetical protein n=1 Tax=Chamaesiphon minutus TaxID=1173032 RepID=UPI0012FCD71C|nr:hypothetical protein [Chamaesiphon minutus]
MLVRDGKNEATISCQLSLSCLVLHNPGENLPTGAHPPTVGNPPLALAFAKRSRRVACRSGARFCFRRGYANGGVSRRKKRDKTGTATPEELRASLPTPHYPQLHNLQNIGTIIAIDINNCQKAGYVNNVGRKSDITRERVVSYFI